MTAAPRPPRKNPLKRTRQPVPLPAARSRAALGLAVGAAEGVFALQVCGECGAVQYPPRDVCGTCLSSRLAWSPVRDTGRLVAETTTRISGDRYFRERTPVRTGIVALDAGPKVIAHLVEGCVVEGAVRVSLRLDHAGRGAVFAAPAETSGTHPALPLANRRGLIVDGRASTSPALAKALAEAGAARIFVGLGEGWKPVLHRKALDAIPAVEIVPLDLADARSVAELAGQIGDKVEILVDNTAHARPGGLIAGQDLAVMRESYEGSCLGLTRLAQAFGPVMRARTADDPRATLAWVTLLSVWALAAPPEWTAYGAVQAARRALSQGMRQEMRASGLRVIDVLTGPIEDDWHQTLPPPKVQPPALAKSVVAAIAEGREEVVVGDVAKDIHARWASDPRLLRQEGLR